jgi:hypothetical protein
MDDPKHTPIRLWPALRLIEANAMDGGDLAIVNRAESCEHHRDMFGSAGVIVSPRAAWVDAQHIASEVIR